MTIVHQLPNYFLSGDPYCFFLITETNSTLDSFPEEDYISVSYFTNKPFPNQGLQIYVVTTQGDFPSPGDHRIK